MIFKYYLYFLFTYDSAVIKANAHGNNVYTFVPKLSGVYTFGVSTLDKGYLDCGECSIFTYDGTKKKYIADYADANSASAYTYSYIAKSATLKAGVTYYIEFNCEME